MDELVKQQCQACRADAPRVSDQQQRELLQQLPDWRIVKCDGVEQLERHFSFADYAGALAFLNRVAVLAEREDHHPAMVLEWGAVRVNWWTHKIGGLHNNDFIAAAKTDAVQAG